jgi:hypothetical protein
MPCGGRAPLLALLQLVRGSAEEALLQQLADGDAQDAAGRRVAAVQERPNCVELPASASVELS